MTESNISSQTPKTFNDEEALSQFHLALAYLSNEDATGQAYAIHRVRGNLEMLSLDHDTQVNLLDAKTFNDISLIDCDYILIDSGNTHGDSWKGFFFPKERLFIHLQEN